MVLEVKFGPGRAWADLQVGLGRGWDWVSG